MTPIRREPFTKRTGTWTLGTPNQNGHPPLVLWTVASTSIDQKYAEGVRGGVMTAAAAAATATATATLQRRYYGPARGLFRLRGRHRQLFSADATAARRLAVTSAR